MSDTDEPAFPQDAQTGNLELWRQGMSLRDYFAGQALAGLDWRGLELDKTSLASRENQTLGESFAERAYYLADVMLKEREK